MAVNKQVREISIRKVRHAELNQTTNLGKAYGALLEGL